MNLPRTTGLSNLRVTVVNRPTSSRSMGAADAAFLYIERKEIPLHIASVCIFDGPIPFTEFVASIDSKLHLVPRYRQVPVFSPLGLAFPTWQDDAHFDLRRHVIRVTLERPGDETQLQALAGQILSEVLDRSKPLWDVHVVDGLKDGRGALIWRVHHSLADGVAGLELLKLLLDPTPDFCKPAAKPRRWRAHRQIQEASLTESISGAINKALGSVLEFEAGILGLAQNLLNNRTEVPLKAIMGLLPEFTAPIERLPFNKPCTGARKFCWTEVDLAEVNRVREIVGGTVNDVILAVLMRALAHYVKSHDQSVVNRMVRIVCPVNLRAPDQCGGLGNQISFLPVVLPMYAHGPIRMLQAVTERTQKLKQCGALGLVGLAAKWLSAAPPLLHAVFWRSIPEIILPVPALNMICTNVAGSPVPLYAVGRKMLAAYPQVPTGYDFGVGCAVHSYDGKLFWGLTADSDAAPDVERLRDFVADSFQELQTSVARKKARLEKRTIRKASEPQAKSSELAQTAIPGEPQGGLPRETGQPRVMKHSKEAA